MIRLSFSKRKDRFNLTIESSRANQLATKQFNDLKGIMHLVNIELPQRRQKTGSSSLFMLSTLFFDENNGRHEEMTKMAAAGSPLFCPRGLTTATSGETPNN